jgi:hypothetical protein
MVAALYEHFVAAAIDVSPRFTDSRSLRALPCLECREVVRSQFVCQGTPIRRLSSRKRYQRRWRTAKKADAVAKHIPLHQNHLICVALRESLCNPAGRRRMTRSCTAAPLLSHGRNKSNVSGGGGPSIAFVDDEEIAVLSLGHDFRRLISVIAPRRRRRWGLSTTAASPLVVSTSTTYERKSCPASSSPPRATRALLLACSGPRQLSWRASRRSAVGR